MYNLHTNHASFTLHYVVGTTGIKKKKTEVKKVKLSSDSLESILFRPKLSKDKGQLTKALAMTLPSTVGYILVGSRTIFLSTNSILGLEKKIRVKLKLGSGH